MKCAVMSTEDDEVLDLAAKKKTRKNYGLNPDKYQLATKIHKSDFQAAESEFRKMKDDDRLEVKLEICKLSRNFLKAKFRTLEPGSHILLLKAFWIMPGGPKVLSEYFKWITDSEQDLAKVAEENIEDCLLMVEKVLILKKGPVWKIKLNELEREAEEDNGNQVLVSTFVLRELAESFKNRPEKAIFVENLDDQQHLSSQPFLHVVKTEQLGEGDYQESVKLSVRIGNTVVFDGVSLTQGLASVIELMFVFNLMYPTDCDDFFEYVQRVILKFGPVSGARNPRGMLKKSFQDFQCCVGEILLESKKGHKKELIL